MTMEALNDLGSSTQCDVPAGTSATTSSHTSLDPLATTTSVATPCLTPSAATSINVGGGIKCPITSSATGSPDNSSMSTSSLSVHNTGVIMSAAPGGTTSSMPLATQSGKMTLSGKKDKLSVTDVVFSTSSTTLSSSAEQSPSATDSDLTGDNPHKLLQAVRSTTLPFPLPVPTYSQAVQAARASGNVLTERATIIRETVKFFLNHKYWWTSEDYDRIAELVVNEFPELRDPIVWPSTPCYSKVRLDLSMCARNIRRIAKNQEKRRGSPRRHSTECTEPAVEPAVKPRKSSGKGGRKGSAQVSMSSPTMVTLQPTGQMLPHTAHTAHATVPTTSTAHDHKEAAGLPFMLTSTVPTSSSSSTVLPPVAHFLGHPSAHSHSPGGIVFPSLLPATLSLATDVSSVVLSTPVASTSGSHQVGEGSTAVPEVVARHEGFMDTAASLAAAWRPDAQLPDPLPVPPYSDKRRVRTDLSQTARNIRRREVMLRRRDSHSPEDRFAAVGTVTMPHSSQQPSTDFCNELLAAASIIESRTAALHQKDVAKALELHAEVSREIDGSTGVITHTQTVKNAEPSRSQVGNGKGLSDSTSVSKEQMSEAAKYPYNYTGASEVMNQGLEPSEGAVLNSQLAVIKQEVGEEESQLDQYQVLQAQAQASQAWFSAQMSQALSMQALTGLSAQMSQALSVAQISEQLMSSQGPSHSTSAQSSTPPAAHQSGSGSGGGGGSTSSQGQATVSLQQLSQVGGYNLPTSTPLSDNNSLADSSHVDRMSAMAMWRSTCLPDPLPTPPYSLNVLRARDSGNTASARPRIIRETTQFFLSMKMWWTTQDYERIAELVLRQFPALKTVQNIKKDLGTCARNMRRRLPLSRNKQWAGYQSPPHSVLKEGDGIGEGGCLTLGELATMASLREAQDKGRAEATSLTSLTEEQRQTLLAHSVYEQNTLAWNALYQQQFSSPAETTPVLPQAHSNKRSLSDTTGSKGIEVAERELAEALKQAGLEQSVKQLDDTDSSHRHSVDDSEGVKSKEMKREHAEKGHRADSSEVSKSESHPTIKELISHSSLSSREQKKMSTESASCLGGQVPHKPALTEVLIHAHQTPVRAHSQPGAQVRPEMNSMEEEVPMNLTCSSEVSKEHKPEKEIKSEPKVSKNGSSGMETFSAREQVWFPHGSPWKKSGQNVFKALPTPLPVPRYSHKLIKAREEGLAYRHRSEIIRETARFFLGFKYWWSSADYSRISELVVLQFPELKDPVAHPGQPCYRRVQRDLSMCARNLRRKNTRRQQLSVGETSPAASPKKAKSGGSKDKKPKKDGDPKRDHAPGYSTVSQAASKEQSEQPHAVITATTSTSLTHTTSQAVSDHCPLPSISNAPVLTSHTTRQAADNIKLTGHVVGNVQTAGAPSFPNLVPNISTTVHTASSSTGQHRQPNIVDGSEFVGLNRENSVVEASLFEKATDKKDSSYPHNSNKGSSTAKSSKSVVLSAHRSQHHTEEGRSTGKGLSKSSKGAGHRVGSTRCSKDLGRHNQLTPSRSSLSEARALSNTTAIVTPTLSEAPAADPRNAEGSISDKVYINPEHGSELQTQLTKLWQEGKFFDASLEVDDYRLPVHKLVLLAASPYLQSTFRHANPTSHLEVNLPRDTGVGAARDFLKYIYQGVLHVAPDTVNALRRIAAMLQIDQLLTYCDDYINCLTGTSTASLSHHSTLPHNSPQVPRVSVNLRDPDHTHSLATDQNSTDLTSQSLELSDGRSSMSMGALHYLQEEPSPSRKRSAMSSVSGQSYQDHYGIETVEDREKGCIVQALSGHSGRQEEMQTGTMLAKRMRPSGKLSSEEQEVATMVLEPQAEINYQGVVDDQQLHLVEDHLNTLQHSALVQHLTSDKVSSRVHSSSVIQRGPNATHMLSHAEQASSDNLEDHEAVAHFLPESGDNRQLSDDAQSQLTEENVTVTLLPQTDVEVEVREEMQVESAHTLQHLSEEEGQVVEEVVVDTGDLLQDVEVAACETVECSLLPQTYCSSPEDSQTLPNHADTALQSMASQWAAQQYAETPLDAATAQQFVSALQERMYGHSSSPSTRDQQSQEASYEQQQEVYMQQCTDTSTIYVSTQPQTTVQELVVETSAMTNSPSQPSKQTSEDSQASLLPQTYCSSPHS